MSLFKVNIRVAAPAAADRESLPVEVPVDTGSELSWLPADVLRRAGIVPRRIRAFLTATKQNIQRDIGYAILRCEGFGVMVDNVAHRFVATTTLAV